ncbi:MAG: cryptochrome/photolyase family protein [Halofilum sp. (in: g-proteobacteria)]|nr:cryptochrome/photolyase family protein [Halofilum sp. (in: g-proteobacteria)]
MSALILVLGDQLDPDVAALRAGDRERDVVLLAEVDAEATYVHHHPQKIALVLSAMRHFAAELRAAGWTVDHVPLDDPDNSGSLRGEVERAVERHGAEAVHVTEPGEWRLANEFDGWPERLGLPVYRHADDRFFCSVDEFNDWAADRKLMRMEDFYRRMRRRHGVLMDADRPAGGQWNYDTANRKPLPKGGLDIPKPPGFRPDAITREVLALVQRRFGHHFGTLDGFAWATTRANARRARTHFIRHALPRFGDYQDAMQSGEPWLFHSVLSPYLNLGLLSPRDLVARAEQAWRDGRAPLNAVEGFVRQILGWREYVRGVYWRHMPAYAGYNALGHERALPEFYWSADTDMHCLREAIETTRDHAYAHHIQRLMVTGNFALLAGIEPTEVCEWYLAVYADAYEWVELPNTLGMALFGDGGMLGSKPYAASGKYIRRMSDYCKSCRYNVNQATGEEACPFNALYWHFLMRHRERIGDNHRLRMPYRNLERMQPARRHALWDQAESFLARLERGDPV